MDKKSHAIQHGFTLIELVIVIVILGILAAIAIPQYTDLKEKASDAAAKATAGALKSSLAIAIADKAAGNESEIYPDVDDLLDNYMTHHNLSVSGGSYTTLIGGVTYTINTYSTTGCTGTANSASTQLVKCIGDASS